MRKAGKPSGGEVHSDIWTEPEAQAEEEVEPMPTQAGFSVLVKESECDGNDEREQRFTREFRPTTKRRMAASLDTQLAACRKYATGNGWTVVRELPRRRVSGTTLARPQLDRLREIVGGTAWRMWCWFTVSTD
jgi:hypothetical protein